MYPGVPASTLVTRAICSRVVRSDSNQRSDRARDFAFSEPPSNDLSAREFLDRSLQCRRLNSAWWANEMAWFIKKKCEPGWAALALHRIRRCSAHPARADGRLRSRCCDSFRKEESDIATLTRLRHGPQVSTAIAAPRSYTSTSINFIRSTLPSRASGRSQGRVRWRVKDIIAIRSTRRPSIFSAIPATPTRRRAITPVCRDCA